MGVISNKLEARFRRAKGQASSLRQQIAADFGAVPRDVKGVEALVRSGHDPLHAAYVAAQNVTSCFSELVSQFPELAPFCAIIEPAESEYIPSGPPVSPLTGSYFTTWAFFDVRFGPDGETIGTCLLDLAGLLKLEPFVVETIRRFQSTRMGIYECRGIKDGHHHLRELVTGDESWCRIASRYQSRVGELLYVRLCPPLLNLVDYHVAFTTPYVLIEASLDDWTAYLNKSVLGSADASQALHQFLKFGPAPRSRKAKESWCEFVFQAYHHHQREAIFLAGLPDVKGSLPNA